MSIQQNPLLKELSLFLKTLNLPTDYFFIVYGSHASNENSDNSDVDVFLAIEHNDEKIFTKLRDFIISFHHKHRLELDEEVPYENKLIVSFEDIDDAVKLKPFITKHEDGYAVPAVQKEAAFLGSRDIRLRLILNALTSPHQFISGEKGRYEKVKTEAEHAVMLLGKRLSGKKEPTGDEVFEALTEGPRGEKNEWWLGYKTDKPAVYNYLKELIERHETI